MATAAKKKTEDTKPEAKAEVPAAKVAEAKAEPKAPAAIFPPYHELTMFVYGDQGTGKTSFFAKSGVAFIIAAEPGAEFLTKAQRPVPTWAAFQKMVDEIVAAKVAGKMTSVKIVAIDTIDRIHAYATRFV